MSSLDNITEFLDVDLEGIRLRNGKKRPSKNKYYFLRDTGYIVSLGGDRWTILDNSNLSRELLTNHTWYCRNGYAASMIPDDEGERVTIQIHRLVSECDDDLMVDHINRCKFDNRSGNLRNVSARMNNRNRSKQSNNVSGKQGVCRTIHLGKPVYRGQISGNNGKQIKKQFSITKLGETEAKRQAIEWRRAMELRLGYIGE
jgi:hypothetical protein